MTRTSPLLLFAFSLLFACQTPEQQTDTAAQPLRITQDEAAGTISVFREKGSDPVLVQNAKPDFRPFIHPLQAPDGKGLLTEYSPGHHRHQTGLYWGFTRVNGAGWEQDSIKKWFYNKDKPAEVAEKIGRDFFHHPDGDYWRRVSATVLTASGPLVKWQTVYDMLDATGKTLMQETQTWSMRSQGGKFYLELEWEGKALEDITINEFDYGGLFLRMPWHEGIAGEVLNAARQRNEKAEGQRAMWVDVGMQVEGRDDWAHMAIFDHPENGGFPQPWRVDGQMGVGPVRAKMGDWHIPQGQTELIRHQIVAYTGQLGDIEMKKLWDEYSGAGSMYSTASLWGIAQEEGRQAKFLTPQEAVESMTLIDGFQVNAWAAEPMITQPMAFCWDDRGRMWIAENRDYESRGSGFSNSGDSRILILEDTDGDGVADSRKVFLEGIPFPSAIAVGFDGLYLGAPPNLLFVPDRNHDDRADTDDIEVLLTGWGIRDRHETINSLHWGPDGWLYGLEGFATPSKIRKPQGEGRLYGHKEPFPEDLLEGEGIDINGGVWRYHPTKDRFEVVAHGFSNPWGIDYDAKGQLFISACVIPHMFHVIPGGIYQRQGGQHFNPYWYSDIQTIVDHRHRSAHGGARIYQSDAFPEQHRGRLFMANIHEHAVLSDILERKGSGFVAHHGDDFLLANNAQWIGFSMEVGPEGGLYVLDWHDADICGKEVLQKETGRVFRITPKQSLAANWEGRYGDLSKLTDEQLAALQTSPSDWHARRARVILQYRATKSAIDPAALASLRTLFQKGKNPDHRLRALWALHVSGGFTAGELSKSLTDKDPYVRAWAIQLLCEDGQPAAEGLDKFAQMAAKDASPVVRLYLAAALQRIDAADRWDILDGLASHAVDADDHNLPDMLWFSMEPLAAADPDRALALAWESPLPKIRQHAARRAVDADATETLVAWLDKRGPARQDFLVGMNAGLEGRFGLKAPANWAAVYTKLQSDKVAAPLALAIAQQFGDSEAAAQALLTLKNKQAPVEQRLEALSRLATQRREPLIEVLPALLDEPALRRDAIRAIAAFDRENLGRLLMERYPSLSAEEKAEAVQTLASRSRYGRMLTQAIKDGSIPKREVPAYVARQLRRVVGNGFVEVWGPIDQLPGDKEADYRKYRRLLTDQALATANPNKGQALFQQTCAACHQLYGEGGNIGPDLTGSNRSNVEYLLGNLLDPSGEIQDDYKMVVITTRDGRTFAGNVASETDRQLTLRVVGQEPVVINLSEIQSRETTPVSMMPEGLLANLSEQEVVDLVGYLRGREE